ncbi:MAG: hypothetical protein MJZ53_02605 [Paludibacteraceae bacterium]|nr:hypothetical protein [Paludibacteraceae bacterium]
MLNVIRGAWITQNLKNMGFLDLNNTLIFDGFAKAAEVAAKIGGKVINLGPNKYGVYKDN